MSQFDALKAFQKAGRRKSLRDPLLTNRSELNISFKQKYQEKIGVNYDLLACSPDYDNKDPQTADYYEPQSIVKGEICFSRDNQYFFCAAKQNDRVDQIKYPSNEVMRSTEITLSKDFHKMGLSEDGTQLLFGVGNSVMICEIESFFKTGEVLFTINNINIFTTIEGLKFNKQGQLLIHGLMNNENFMIVKSIDLTSQINSIDFDKLQSLYESQMPPFSIINQKDNIYLLKIKKGQCFNLGLFDLKRSLVIDNILNQNPKFDILFQEPNYLIDIDDQFIGVYELDLELYNNSTPGDSSPSNRNKIHQLEFTFERYRHQLDGLQKVRLAMLFGDTIFYCDLKQHKLIEYNFEKQLQLNVIQKVFTPLHVRITQIFDDVEKSWLWVINYYNNNQYFEIKIRKRFNICTDYFNSQYIDTQQQRAISQGMSISYTPQSKFGQSGSNILRFHNLHSNHLKTIEYPQQFEVLRCFYDETFNSMLISCRIQLNQYDLKLVNLSTGEVTNIVESAKVHIQVIEVQSYSIPSSQDYCILLNVQDIMRLSIKNDCSFKLEKVKEFPQPMQYLKIKYLPLENKMFYFQTLNKTIHVIDMNGDEYRTIVASEKNTKIMKIVDLNLDDFTLIYKAVFHMQRYNYDTKKVIAYRKAGFKNEYYKIYKQLMISLSQNKILIYDKNNFNLKMTILLNFNLISQNLNDHTREQLQIKFKANHKTEGRYYVYNKFDQKKTYQIDLFSRYHNIQLFLNYIPNSKYQEYDENTGFYTFYNNDTDMQKICHINVKFFDQDADFYKLIDLTDNDLIQYIRNSDIERFLFNSYPFFTSYMHQIALRPFVIEEILKKLQFLNKDSLPLLLSKNRNGFTPFDIAVEKNQVKSVALFLDMMIKFQENTWLNYIFDPHICTMLERGYNLREYFLSFLPDYQIQEEWYPSLHPNATTQIFACNADSPFDLLTQEKYEEIIGKIIDGNEAKDKKLNGNKLIQSNENENDSFEDKVFENRIIESKAKENKANDNQVLYAIEYFLINIPDTITNTNFINILAQTPQIEIFETQCIRTIIDFKWNKYTYGFFFKQFMIYMVFIGILMVDLYYTLSKDQNADKIHRIQMTLKCLCLFVQLYFIQYEMRSAIRQGVKDYFSDIWNYFDLLLLLTYIATSIVDFLQVSLSLRNILLCVVLLLSFVKLNFFLRIFDGFSFMVSMIQGVFLDLRYFMTFFFLTVGEFGLLFNILVQISEEYESINSAGYFLMAFRTSLGDFDLDSYGTTYEEGKIQLEIVILRWLVWIVGVFIMNIVFMNFIIAVISESYEKVMQKLNAQCYKVKVEMIAERELHFNDKEFKDPELYPKYLILRKPVENEENNQQDWQGFVKDIKIHVSKTITKGNNDLQTKIDMIQKEMKDNQKYIKSIQQKVSTLEDRLHQNDKEIKKNMQENQKIQDENFSELKSMLSAILQKEPSQGPDSNNISLFPPGGYMGGMGMRNFNFSTQSQGI